MTNDIGVPILTGTDITDAYTFAGFSVHDELEDKLDIKLRAC